MKIPKAYVFIKTQLGIAPTEKQLREYFNLSDDKTIEELVNDFGGWEELYLDWFLNTNANDDFKKYQLENNIFHIDNDNESFGISLISDEDWKELEDNDLIY